MERCPEKYANKLIRRTDRIENALKRLDTLTHEEAWMGIAQNLRAMHIVGKDVRRVVDNVTSVGDRVTVVGDRLAEVSRGA